MNTYAPNLLQNELLKPWAAVDLIKHIGLQHRSNMNSALKQMIHQTQRHFLNPLYLLCLNERMIRNEICSLTYVVDSDLGLQDLLLRFQYSNAHTNGLQRSCRGKGQCGHSLKRRVFVSASATPSRGERHYPCLDKLLLVFQAPYIKEGSLLL